MTVMVRGRRHDAVVVEGGGDDVKLEVRRLTMVRWKLSPVIEEDKAVSGVRHWSMMAWIGVEGRGNMWQTSLVVTLSLSSSTSIYSDKMDLNLNESFF
jgi:hypothetical protein